MTPFSEDYFEARERFRAAATRAGATQQALEIAASSDGRPLTCDVASLGDGPNALVVSSGIHGVEGFAGSALQIDLLDHPPKGIRLVLLHALNPYGMAERRRVNESNVDLNRNFLGPGEAYGGSPEGYAMLDPLLNPDRPFAGPDAFLLHAVLKIARHGFAPLKQATTEGQYEMPKGLFFGGASLERGPALVLDAMRSALDGAERVIQLDVHTGLGRYGGATVLATEKLTAEGLAATAETLGAPVQPWNASAGVAYAIRGAYGEAVVRLLSAARVRFFTVEFGTSTPLRVVSALRSENQATQWGGDLVRARERLLRTFNPDDERWRLQVIERGRSLLGALGRMAGA